jgi:hypothetical protein
MHHRGATVIQRAWKRRSTRALVSRWRSEGITAEKAREIGFDSVVSVVKSLRPIAGPLLKRVCHKFPVTVNENVVLTAYMVAVHSDRVFLDERIKSDTLIQKARATVSAIDSDIADRALLASIIADYQEEYMVWKDMSAQVMAPVFKGCLISLYQAKANLDDGHELLPALTDRILHYRKNLRIVCGADVLAAFDEEIQRPELIIPTERKPYYHNYTLADFSKPQIAHELMLDANFQFPEGISDDQFALRQANQM